MNAKFQAVLVSALALLAISPVLQAQYPGAGCWDDITEQKTYYSKVFPTGEGQEREICYETKVECTGGHAGGMVEWNVWTIPWGNTELTIPWLRWFAMTDDRVDFCGSNYESLVQVFANLKQWSTSCEFYNGSEFSAKITEVDPARCGIEQ